MVLADPNRLINRGIEAAWNPMAFDGVVRSILPGQSLNGFVMSSFGPPGVRAMEVQPSLSDVLKLLPPEWKGQETDSDTVLHQKEKLVNSLGFLTNTLGPTALPAGYTNAVLVTRLQGYVDQSTGPFVDDGPTPRSAAHGSPYAGVCGLAAEPGGAGQTLLQQFVTAVTSASLSQRRQEASDLLSLNAQFIVDNIAVVSPTTAILSPESAQHALNETHTSTLTVTSGSGPVVSGRVQAKVVSGPNAGVAISGGTNANGQWTFSYMGLGEGTDIGPGSLQRAAAPVCRRR